MRVSLQFRLYMMRFGPARLAAAFATARNRTPDAEITKRVVDSLTKTQPLPAEARARFMEYLEGKPGSPKYTPLRRKLEAGELPVVERQDLLLSARNRRSTVGALSKNYFDDPRLLAQALGLVSGSGNHLLSRGKLSALDSGVQEDPFDLPRRQELFLAHWLADVDGDWLWSLFREMDARQAGEITIENRVALLQGTFDRLVDTREIRGRGSEDLAILKRLRQVASITARNQREGLNLGQPWSWFLIPRLELLVDACILDKAQPSGLTGYRLTPAGESLLSLSRTASGAQSMVGGFLNALMGTESESFSLPTWASVQELLRVADHLRNPAGYYPLFETAVAIAVEQALLHSKIWEVPQIESVLTEVPAGELIFGTDRHGKVVSFKARE